MTNFAKNFKLFFVKVSIVIENHLFYSYKFPSLIIVGFMDSCGRSMTDNFPDFPDFDDLLLSSNLVFYNSMLFILGYQRNALHNVGYAKLSRF